MFPDDPGFKTVNILSIFISKNVNIVFHVGESALNFTLP
jgi:hypothetical protein